MSAVERDLSELETEVVAKPVRRRFTLGYKRKIVREADACKTLGAAGALLRREGLYSSRLIAPSGETVAMAATTARRARGGPL